MAALGASRGERPLAHRLRARRRLRLLRRRSFDLLGLRTEAYALLGGPSVNQWYITPTMGH